MRCHWLDSELPCSPSDLEAAGVLYQELSTDPARYEPALRTLMTQRGYVARDEVALSKDTANLDAILKKFHGEHLHTDDEVRFVLSGEGIFDVRSVDDRWMRIVVEAGDLLVVSKDRYHRFLLTDCTQIRCVRLFQDQSGWVPHYREIRA